MLQKWAIVPDKIVSMAIRKSSSRQRMVAQCQSINGTLPEWELEQITNRMWLQFETNNREVLQTFGNFVFHYDMNNKGQGEAANDICTMLKLRYSQMPGRGKQRRAPRIFLVGPSGSGRSSQAEAMSKMYGLVNVSVQNLAAEEAKTNPAIQERIRQCLAMGEEIPDDISIRLVRNRIMEPDCRINGFILDGFPQTETQINLLKTLNIKPTLVVMLEVQKEECVSRLNKRRVDPITGESFNLEVGNQQPATEA